MSSSAEHTRPGMETPVDKLREVVAGLIDVVATQGGKAIDTLGLRIPGGPWIPNVDLIEKEDHLLVLVDLPGIDPNSVEIQLTGNMLTLSGPPPAWNVASGEIVHRRERHSAGFSRSIPLPVSINPEQVSAEAHEGVLSIRLGKEERLKPRHIRVDVKQPAAPA